MSHYTLKKEQNAIKIEQSKNKNEGLWINTVKVEGLKETGDTLLKRRKQWGNGEFELPRICKWSLSLSYRELHWNCPAEPSWIKARRLYPTLGPGYMLILGRVELWVRWFPLAKDNSQRGAQWSVIRSRVFLILGESGPQFWGEAAKQITVSTTVSYSCYFLHTNPGF